MIQLISPLLSPPIGPSRQPTHTPTSQLAPASTPSPQTSFEAPPSVPASHHTVSSASPASQPPGRDQSAEVKHRAEARLFWVQITNLLFCGCMTLGKLMSLSLNFFMCNIRIITPTYRVAVRRKQNKICETSFLSLSFTSLSLSTENTWK